MLPGHPIAVCGEDSGELVGVDCGEVGLEVAPFVAVDAVFGGC